MNYKKYFIVYVCFIYNFYNTYHNNHQLSTIVDKIWASVTAWTGRASINIISKVLVNSFKSAFIFFVPRSSAGLGGTGPLVKTYRSFTSLVIIISSNLHHYNFD